MTASEEQYEQWNRYSEASPESTDNQFSQMLMYLGIFLPGTRSGVGCPFGGLEGGCSRYRSVLWMMVHLNDQHKMSREDIADWLEGVAEERGFDLSFPTPEDVPKEPGEE